MSPKTAPDPASRSIASQTVDRRLEYFGRGISTIINVLAPDVIVLGGGVGNVAGVFGAALL